MSPHWVCTQDHWLNHIGTLEDNVLCKTSLLIVEEVGERRLLLSIDDSLSNKVLILASCMDYYYGVTVIKRGSSTDVYLSHREYQPVSSIVRLGARC